MIILLALAGYVLVGHLVPGQLQTRKVEMGELLVYLNLDNNGLLGIVLQITVIVIIPFVLMGQLLMRSGGSNFFNDARDRAHGPLPRRRRRRWRWSARACSA